LSKQEAGEAVLPYTWWFDNFQESEEGFCVEDGIIKILKHSIRLMLSTDTTIISPEFLQLSSEIYNEISIKIHNKSDCNFLKFYWQTNDMNEFDEFQCYALEIKNRVDEFIEYKIELSSIIRKNATIKRFCFIFIGDFKNQCIDFISIKFRNEDEEKIPLIGAIRWDAWSKLWTKSLDGLVIERSFFDNYSYREPLNGWFNIDYPVGTCPDYKNIIRQENILAKYYGIDYWAFDWDCSTIPGCRDQVKALCQPLEVYLEIHDNEKPDFALIVMPAYSGLIQRWDNYFSCYYIPSLLNLFQNPKYLKINDNRPVSFIHTSAFFGERFADYITAISALLIVAALSTLYIIKKKKEKENGKNKDLR
jgi:hypothetical protein